MISLTLGYITAAAETGGFRRINGIQTARMVPIYHGIATKCLKFAKNCPITGHVKTQFISILLNSSRYTPYGAQREW